MLDALERWLRLSAERIHDQSDALTGLDRAIGDGDHGINMDRGFSAIVAKLDAGIPEGEADGDQARAATVLRTAGRTLISTVGGAAGPLYGTGLMRAGGAIAAAEPGRLEGETLANALVPAHSAGQAVLDAGGDVDALVRTMADAAEAGATATIPMVATKGRASYLGERSIGHQDPGATSSALLLRALADAVTAG